MSPITFGGGYAVIPLIEKEVISKRNWVEKGELTNLFAVSQSIPGAIAINAATMIGYRIAGVAGALAAMAGIVLPTFLIVIALCILFLHVHQYEPISAALEGIRVAIVALIAYAGYHIGRTAIFDKTTFITVGITVLLLFSFKLSPFFVILTGAIAGILVVRIKESLGIVTRLEKDEQLPTLHESGLIKGGK
jgi:chromate transporter